MGLPAEDSGPDMPVVAYSNGGEDALLELPPDDSGHDLLPEISGGEDMFKTPAKRARRTSGVAAGSPDPPLVICSCLQRLSMQSWATCWTMRCRRQTNAPTSS